MKCKHAKQKKRKLYKSLIWWETTIPDEVHFYASPWQWQPIGDCWAIGRWGLERGEDTAGSWEQDTLVPFKWAKGCLTQHGGRPVLAKAGLSVMVVRLWLEVLQQHHISTIYSHWWIKQNLYGHTHLLNIAFISQSGRPSQYKRQQNKLWRDRKTCLRDEKHVLSSFVYKSKHTNGHPQLNRYFPKFGALICTRRKIDHSNTRVHRLIPNNHLH